MNFQRNQFQQQSQHHDLNRKKELEATINMIFDELKSETFRYLDMKLTSMNPNRNFSSYDQHPAEIIK